MQFDPARLRTGFDWAFRPQTYFLPGAAPPPGRLPDAIRTAIGRIHPSLMGGLYLPEFLPNEVEIARVQLQSVTGDVISVRARPEGGRIAYRVVDEYDTEYSVAPASSTRPLTLEAIASLIENADPDSSAHGGLALGAVQMNVIDGGCDPREMVGFATVTSRFYPELGAWFERLINAWLETQLAESFEDEEETGEGGANENAR